MFRDVTFTDVSRAEALDDACAGFVMDEDASAHSTIGPRAAYGPTSPASPATARLADDLLQETFYRFLRAAATHESEAHRRNSLYRIATNLARDAAAPQPGSRPLQPAGDDIESVPSRR